MQLAVQLECDAYRPRFDILMPTRGKITAEMPVKWVPNAAKRSSGFHETQNAFCPVKAVVGT
jgi:hypothetical protein